MDRQSFDNVRIRYSITVVKQTGLSIHQISFKNISNGAESVEQFFTNIRVTYSSKAAPDWVGKIERKHFYLPNFVVTWYTRYAASSARQQKPWLTCHFGRHRYGSQKNFRAFADIYRPTIFGRSDISYIIVVGDRWDPSKVVKKTDCQELLEVHRNVIDVKSIAFLMILLAPEVSFVTLHMRWRKGCCSNSNHKKLRVLLELFKLAWRSLDH